MTVTPSCTLRNGEAVGRGDVPVLDGEAFRRGILESVADDARISALFGRPRPDGGLRLFAVLARRDTESLSILSTDVGDRYPALTPDCPQAHLFEREIAERWGVRPEGHPWLKPVRFHVPAPAVDGHDVRDRPSGGGTGRGTPEARTPPGGAEFFRVDGGEIHEVAVGPVHAGVIEPGHFRFQCHGEEVLHLEIALGYQHRGVERALEGGPTKRTIHTLETLAGDTSVGHAVAYAQAVEALAGCRVPPRAEALRAIGLELERLANHAGDLGAMSGDVGYLPTASYCGRIRGDFLNLTALLCGSRFGRGWVRPGGVGFDVEPPRAAQLLERLDPALRDVMRAADLLWDTPSVMGRFEETGTVPNETGRSIGLVGPAARACGIRRDVRLEFPSGFYRFAQIPISTCPTGDVLARAQVRALEIRRSAAFVREQLRALPDGPLRATVGPLAPDRVAVSLVEGWRGEICHVAMTDGRGRFEAYKVVDPSFHNWFGLALAMRGQAISDFPLCNKSFNLSYCGHDL